MNRFVMLAAAVLVAAPAVAGVDHRPAVTELVAEKLRADFSGAEVVAAIQAQNAAHAALAQGDIDALDQTWRAEAEKGGGAMTAGVLGNALSAMLKDKVAAYQGLITEVFVMDDKGLNVGQASMTSDYWQGDEDKFQKTYGVGADAVFVDEIEFDESSQTLQTQVSFTIVDPASGSPVGAVTIGLNMDALGL